MYAFTWAAFLFTSQHLAYWVPWPQSCIKYSTNKYQYQYQYKYQYLTFKYQYQYKYCA